MKRPTGTPKRTGRSPVADKRAAEAEAKPAVRRHKGRVRRGNVVVRTIAGTVSLIWRILWGSAWRLAMVLALIVGAATAYFYAGLPAPEALFDARARGSVTMLDNDGKVFAWRGETYGAVTSDKIAPVLKEAVIATEDRRFYGHLGISPRWPWKPGIPRTTSSIST